MADTVKAILQRPGSKLVTLHSGETFKVPNSLFRLFPLKPGEEVEAPVYLGKLLPQQKKHALEQAVRYLEARDRSTAELRGKLLQVGYEAEAAQAAGQFLEDAGYLDDARYAGQSLQRLGKKYGALRIRQELRQKGIDKPLIEETLSSQDEEEALQTAVGLAQKAARGRQDPGTAYRRAYGMLARRGFPPPLVKKALALVFTDSGEDASGV